MAGAIRHPIDIKALEAWIAENVPEIELPLDVKQFGFGQSNPTYQLTTPSGARYVLRKKPPGKLISQGAHKVEREHRIIAALGGGRTGVPVPRALGLCEDAAVVGTPFYLMSFLDGRILEDPAVPGAASPRERRALWGEAARTLAALHRVDPAAVGLASFGRPSGFYGRQVATWSGICEAQARVTDADTGVAVGQLPHFADLMRFFADAARQPRDRGTLIHGDYKIDNLVFHKTEPRVIGILDWEMSTIGHPLSDLANLLTPYLLVKLGTHLANANPGFVPGATPGLPTRDEVIDIYFSVIDADEDKGHDHGDRNADDEENERRRKQARRALREREMQWAEAFSVFRNAAVCQGIAARFAARQASSAQAARYAELRIPIAEYAWRLVQMLGTGSEDDDGVDAGGGVKRGPSSRL